MATIQVLGTGCAKCSHLAEQTAKALRDAGRDENVEKITDIVRILEFSPMALPALAVNGRVVCAGSIPSPQQIMQLISPESSAS